MKYGLKLDTARGAGMDVQLPLHCLLKRLNDFPLRWHYILFKDQFSFLTDLFCGILLLILSSFFSNIRVDNFVFSLLLPLCVCVWACEHVSMCIGEYVIGCQRAISVVGTLLLPPICVFQVLKSCCQACLANTFIQWAILPTWYSALNEVVLEVSFLFLKWFWLFYFFVLPCVYFRIYVKKILLGLWLELYWNCESIWGELILITKLKLWIYECSSFIYPMEPWVFPLSCSSFHHTWL